MAKKAKRDTKHNSTKKSGGEMENPQANSINDYHYVITDLKRIGITSGLLISLLVILSIII